MEFTRLRGAVELIATATEAPLAAYLRANRRGYLYLCERVNVFVFN